MDNSTSQRDVFEELFDNYADDVYRYARMILKNDADANDVVQEVFIKAFRNWSGYRGEAQAKTWLLRITKNYIIDIFRKKQTEKRFLQNFIPLEEPSLEEIIEIVKEVEEALSLLKENYRQVLLLRHVENLSIKDAATCLGWSEKKVRVTSHRAMQRFKEVIEKNSKEVE